MSVAELRELEEVKVLIFMRSAVGKGVAVDGFLRCAVLLRRRSSHPADVLAAPAS
jgi:hypothetical protein